jgi:Sulfatase
MSTIYPSVARLRLRCRELTPVVRAAFFGLLLAILAAALLVSALRFTQTLTLSAPALKPDLPYQLGFAWLTVAFALGLQPSGRTSRVVFLTLTLLLFGTLNAVDLTFLTNFSEHAVVVGPLLPPPQSSALTYATLISVASQYVPLSFILISCLFAAPAFTLLYLFCSYKPFAEYRFGRLCSAILPVVVALLFYRPFALPTAEGAESRGPAKPLEAVDRSAAIVLTGPAVFKPRTILLILNENTSFFFSSAVNSKVSLVDRLKDLSGDPERWIVFSNAVTNASCTDVSHPSLFTGTGSYESFTKLHKMPFIFDLAKARGYKTIFYTSQTLEWANLATFFSTAKIDRLFSASVSGQPVVNDLGIDDIYAMRRLADLIRKERDEDLFIVAGTNAMHEPFQLESSISIPAEIKGRRERALYVLESDHKVLFDALRASGRLSEALIIVTADHGTPLSRAQRYIPRVENYAEETLRVPFLVHLPASMLPQPMAALRANRDNLVANIDIAPTLAHLLGVGLTGDLSYMGYSLFSPIPGSRLSVAISTNEWRHWPATGLALARGKDRFICHSTQGCVFYSVADHGVTAETQAVKYEDYLREGLNLPLIGPKIIQILQSYDASRIPLPSIVHFHDQLTLN